MERGSTDFPSHARNSILWSVAFRPSSSRSQIDALGGMDAEATRARSGPFSVQGW